MSTPICNGSELPAILLVINTDFGRTDFCRIDVPALALVDACRRRHGLVFNADFGRVVVQALAF